MKKFFYTLSVALLLAVSAIGFAGCGGYSVNPNKLVGVWEVVDEGGYTEITRIEFKAPQEEGANGRFTYYIDGSSVAHWGSWVPMSDTTRFNILFDDDSVLHSRNPHEARLAEGRLYLMFNLENNEVTNTYEKISD